MTLTHISWRGTIQISMRSRHHCRDHPHSANNCSQNARNDRALREIAPFLHCITAPTPHMHRSCVKASVGKASEWHHMICKRIFRIAESIHGKFSMESNCASNINALYLSSFDLSMLCLSSEQLQSIQSRVSSASLSKPNRFGEHGL